MRDADVMKALGRLCGFNEFSSKGVVGLRRVSGRRLDVLAIAAEQPGNGACRQFLDRSLAHFTRVRFYFVESEILRAALVRRGFVDAEWLDAGELCQGMVWRKPQRA